MIHHYNRDGQVIPLLEWAKLIEDDEYRRVASTIIEPWWVSTVWTGIDLGLYVYDGDVVPIIFETMIFDTSSESPYRPLDMWRCATEEQALIAHDQAIELVGQWSLEGTSGWE